MSGGTRTGGSGGAVPVPDKAGRFARGEARATYDVDWEAGGSLSDQVLMDWMLTMYEDAKRRRTDWEAQASLQLAYARGNQWVRWSAQDRDLVPELGGMDSEERITINFLRGRVFQWIAMLLGRPITWNNYPVTHDDDDVNGARIGSKLLRYYWENKRTTSTVIDALWMMYCTGVSWLHVGWDSNAGGDIAISASDLAADVDGGNAGAEGEFRRKLAKQLNRQEQDIKLDENKRFWVRDGDVYIDHVSGFDLSEPLGCRKVDEAAWLIHTKIESVEKIRHRYGQAANDVQADSFQDEHITRHSEQYGAKNDYTSAGAGGVADSDVVIHRVWRPKTPELPNGYFAVMTKELVLHSGFFPFKHGRLPFVTLAETPDPEHFRPGCTVRDLMGLQRAVNRERSYLHAHLKKTISPKILVEKGAGLPEDAFDDTPQIIPLNPEGISKVKAWVPEQLPNYALSLQQLNQLDIETVSRLHRSTMGGVESAGQSGKLAKALQAGDQKANTVTKMLVEDALRLAGQQLLWVVWEKVETERITPITGSSSESEVLAWRGVDLAPKRAPFGPFEFNIKVTIVGQEDFQESFAKVTMLTELGYMRPENQEDRLLVLGWLGEGSPIESEEMQKHRANAALEHQMILKGQRIVTNTGDDDMIHIHRHRLWMATSSQYRQRVIADPAVADKMEQHLLAHTWGNAWKTVQPAAIAEKVKRYFTDYYQLQPEPDPNQQGAGPQSAPAKPPGGARAGVDRAGGGQPAKAPGGARAGANGTGGGRNGAPKASRERMNRMGIPLVGAGETPPSQRYGGLP